LRLATLGLSNFKSFAGDHQIALPDRGPSKPLYLVGGLNGAGKTTLAQATVLALHGERAAGLPGLFRPGRGSRDRYERWLGAAFNRHARTTGEEQMRVLLQFEDNGTRVGLTRSWWFDASGTFLEEQLEVREDRGRDTTLLVGGDAQALVDELLPRHLLDFAIFDGEQVRRLDDTLSATAVRGALDRLLNLDAVERMRVEIERLARERRLAHADTAQLDRYAALRNQLDELSIERSSKAAELGKAERRQERMQRELDELAGNFDAALSATSTSGQLSADLITLRERRGTLRARLGRHLSEWLYLWPLLDVLPVLAEDVAGEREQRTGRDRLKLEFEAVASLADEVTRDRRLRRAVGVDAVRKFREWVDGSLAGRRADLDSATIEAHASALGQFSDSELSDIESALSAARRDLGDVQDLASDLLRVDRRIREMEGLLAAADRDSATAQLLRRRDELNVLLGEQRAAADRLRVDLEALDSELSSVRSQLAHLEQRLNVTEGDMRWLETADATVAALDEFLAEARAEASFAVRSRMVQNLNVLLRKDNLVADVVIDPTTHVTRLLADDGSDVELPSAAEHQLAAMAFIDAVLAAADNPIPVFVDTPLARLDSMHRRAVVRDFWPNLGRQVIVLSTDEEVVDDLFIFAEPSVAATYRIDCDADGRSAIVIDKYLEVAAS
jgi:DNA sulfur modification protein DndD